MTTLRVLIEATTTGSLIMPRELHPENLIPTNKRTKEEVRRNSRKGGIKSGEVRREKKLLSQMWGEFLSKRFDVKIEGEAKKLTGAELVEQTGLAVMARKDSSSVSMIKEIREATEGNKINHTGTTAQVIVSDKKTVKEVVAKLWD